MKNSAIENPAVKNSAVKKHLGISLFDKRVDRSNSQSLKDMMTPQRVKDAGLVCYWGAEFDFPTCPAFSRGVAACAERGLYAFTMQNDRYNEQVVWWMWHVRGWEVSPEWIVPTHGTIFGLASAIRIFCSKEKSLLVFSPGYNRYAQAASRMGLPFEYLQLLEPEDQAQMAQEQGKQGQKMTGRRNGYRIDFPALEKRLASGQIGLIVLCNPNNPTGTVFQREELEQLDALSRRYQVPVYSDEIFAEVILDEGVRAVPFGEISGTEGLSMTCTSLGKCMSLTGVNHANVLIPNPALRERYIHQKYADHYGSIDPMLYAGLMEAYTEEGKAFVEELCEVIRENVRILEQRLPEIISGARVVHPQGTYVAWVDYRRAGMDSEALRRFLEEEALFYGDVGTDYNDSAQFYRYSLAVPPKELQKSMDFMEHLR